MAADGADALRRSLTSRAGEVRILLESVGGCLGYPLEELQAVADRLESNRYETCDSFADISEATAQSLGFPGRLLRACRAEHLRRSLAASPTAAISQPHSARCASRSGSTGLPLHLHEPEWAEPRLRQLASIQGALRAGTVALPICSGAAAAQGLLGAAAGPDLGIAVVDGLASSRSVDDGIIQPENVVASPVADPISGLSTHSLGGSSIAAISKAISGVHSVRKLRTQTPHSLERRCSPIAAACRRLPVQPQRGTSDLQNGELPNSPCPAKSASAGNVQRCIDQVEPRVGASWDMPAYSPRAPSPTRAVSPLMRSRSPERGAVAGRTQAERCPEQGPRSKATLRTTAGSTVASGRHSPGETNPCDAWKELRPSSQGGQSTGVRKERCSLQGPNIASRDRLRAEARKPTQPLGVVALGTCAQSLRTPRPVAAVGAGSRQERVQDAAPTAVRACSPKQPKVGPSLRGCGSATTLSRCPNPEHFSEARAISPRQQMSPRLRNSRIKQSSHQPGTDSTCSGMVEPCKFPAHPGLDTRSASLRTGLCGINTPCRRVAGPPPGPQSGGTWRCRSPAQRLQEDAEWAARPSSSFGPEALEGAPAAFSPPSG